MTKQEAVMILEDFKENCMTAGLQYLKEKDQEACNEAFLLAYAIQFALDYLNSLRS